MPRIAILSDVHSNLNALGAVLRDIDEQGGVDRIYCLGDLVGYGPRPNECLALARQRFQLMVRGNHEEALVQGAKDFNEMARRAIDWTRAQIIPDYERATPEQRANWSYVATLPERFSEGTVQYLHGAPQDPVNEYIMPMDIDPQARRYGQKLYTAFTMTQWLTFCGHSHMPAAFCQDGTYFSPTYQRSASYNLAPTLRYLVNVGSVGQPRDGDNRACYAVFADDVVTWRRVPYDIQDTFNNVVAIRDLDITLGERLFRGE